MSAVATEASTSGSSLVDVFLTTVARQPAAPAARFKKDGAWVDMTWQEMADTARRYAFGLIALGVQPGDRVNLLGATTIDWVLCELGVHMAGAVSVPIYQTNPPADCAYVVQDCGGVLAFAENADQLAKLQEVHRQLPTLKRLIRMDGQGDDEVLDLERLAALGDEHAANEPEAVDVRIAAIDPAQAACFIYTSGTTGPPKGVVLSHDAWAFEGRATAELGLVTPDDIQLLFLPLAHSFAQVLKTAWFATGHIVAFAESMDKLVANLAEVRPTVMAAVPRVFEKVYSKVVAGGMESPGLKGAMFRWAFGHVERYAAARKRGEEYGGLGFSLAKSLVLKKVAAKLDETFGGRVKFFISGGAPLSPAIAFFFELVGVTVLEGYGLTETAAATCVNRPGKVKIGTVGPAVPGMELRIAEDGEVLIRGPGVMTGYHGKPEATAEAIDAQGWFRSGDIGELDDEGYLTITDRKKDIIVTAGGKNVAPQNLENTLKTYPLISQAVVHGDKRKYLVALVTVDPAATEDWARERGIAFDALADLVAKPEVVAEVQGYFDAMNEDLPRYLTVKYFRILDHDFSQETGELTPTLKVKRRVVEKRYADLLASMYE